MSKLLGDLHIMLGLLESVLKSYHIDCVAGPGVDASKLLGICQGFIPWHALALWMATTENEALGLAQKSTWHIDCQHRLEKVF